MKIGRGSQILSLIFMVSPASPMSISIEIEDVIKPAFAFALVIVWMFPIFAVIQVKANLPSR